MKGLSYYVIGTQRSLSTRFSKRRHASHTHVLSRSPTEELGLLKDVFSTREWGCGWEFEEVGKPSEKNSVPTRHRGQPNLIPTPFPKALPPKYCRQCYN